MYKEPKPMQEIHEIQEKIYEDYKNLSDKEKIKRIHEESEEAERKLGLKLRRAAHV